MLIAVVVMLVVVGILKFFFWMAFLSMKRKERGGKRSESRC